MFDINRIQLILEDLLKGEGSVDIFKDSIDAYARTRDSSEFNFLISRSNNLERMILIINEHINQESDRKSGHDIHRSELWRKAVISATDVKHSDPMSFADKVLSHYDEKFNIK